MITGALGGIGRVTAVRLAGAGHVVFAADRPADDLKAFAAQHPGVRPVILHVTDAASIDKAREQVGAQTAGYGLDVLVNAAGILVLGPATAVPDAQARTQFEVNLFGALAVTRAFLSAMRERGNGRVINVSSILGRFALPGSGVYSASKFALEALSDALRIELAPFGVRVVLVQPGVIDTPLHQRAAAALPGYDQALQPYRPAWPAGFEFLERLLKAATPADGIAATLVKAALAPPRARYQRGLRNRINTQLLTTLPTQSSDRIKTRIAGLATPPRPPLLVPMALGRSRGSVPASSSSPARAALEGGVVILARRLCRPAAWRGCPVPPGTGAPASLARALWMSAPTCRSPAQLRPIFGGARRADDAAPRERYERQATAATARRGKGRCR
jgi:NAD(P)-dependent dehydrogenase (short-subunit alcohol dehydrogenase family)